MTQDEYDRLLDATEFHNRQWCTCDECARLRCWHANNPPEES